MGDHTEGAEEGLNLISLRTERLTGIPGRWDSLVCEAVGIYIALCPFSLRPTFEQIASPMITNWLCAAVAPLKVHPYLYRDERMGRDDDCVHTFLSQECRFACSIVSLSIPAR